jgi:hypothetical protein
MIILFGLCALLRLYVCFSIIIYTYIYVLDVSFILHLCAACLAQKGGCVACCCGGFWKVLNPW